MKHPNIVELLGVAACDNEITIIMTYVQGENLHKLIFGKEQIVTKVKIIQNTHIKLMITLCH